MPAFSRRAALKTLAAAAGAAGIESLPGDWERPRVGIATLPLAAAASSVPPPNDALALAAVFAPWYGYDFVDGSYDPQRYSEPQGTHWGDDWATLYRPEKGYYCSADPAVVDWQLDQLESMGVRALFVSWWGWGDANLDGSPAGLDGAPDGDVARHDSYMNRGIRALLDGIRRRNSPIRVALVAEPFPATQVTPNRDLHASPLSATEQARIRDWLWTNYYGDASYRDLMFQWNDRPLLVAFDSLRLDQADSRYTIRLWSGRAKSAAAAEGWQWFFAPPCDASQSPADVVANLSSDGVAFVYPRFEEKYLNPGYVACQRHLDPDLTVGLYRRQFEALAESRSNLHLVVLYSWNLYGEQAHVEPSSGGPGDGWAVGFDYVAKTRDYFAALRDRQSIPPSPTLREAVAFLRRQFDSSVALLREAPQAAPNRYWLLNDNAVATLALDALGEGVLAQKLRATLQSKGMLAADGSPIGIPLAVLWGKTVVWPPKSFVYTRVSGAPLGTVDPGSLCYGSSCAFEVVYEHWDGGGTFDDWAEYANLAAIGALNEWNSGRQTEARQIFAALIGTFDGKGFPDKGYLANPQHEYETFKLALALYVGLKIGGLDGPTATSLADALLAKRHAADGTDQAGGFHTHYTATELRGDVNTETTALAILALREHGN